MPRPLRIVPFFAALAVAIWVASCGGGDGGMTKPPPPPPNRAPTAVGSIAAQTITAGESATVNVSSNFNDPDGDALTYTAATSDAGVATASVAGSTVTITGVAAGSATITVTARDPGGLSATQTISVTVEAANQPPVAGRLAGRADLRPGRRGDGARGRELQRSRRGRAHVHGGQFRHCVRDRHGFRGHGGRRRRRGGERDRDRDGYRSGRPVRHAGSSRSSSCRATRPRSWAIRFRRR